MQLSSAFLGKAKRVHAIGPQQGLCTLSRATQSCSQARPAHRTHSIPAKARLSSLRSRCLHHTSISEGCSGRWHTWSSQAGRSCWRSGSCLRPSYRHSRPACHTARIPECNVCWRTAIRRAHTGDALQAVAFGYQFGRLQEQKPLIYTNGSCRTPLYFAFRGLRA